jgi:carbonic anhydrase/acetyltransferase-like protein (isoleucine patch superfamily)
MIYRLGERSVTRHPTAWVAPNATVIGSVVLEEASSVWFCVTIRGDNDLITVGPESNIQDGTVLHTDEGIPLTLGRGVTVGHRAMLHGCTVGDYTLVGIGATVLNGAVIGNHCIIGAHAMVPEGMEIPDRSLVVGLPARVIRTIDDATATKLDQSAAHYVRNAAHYRAQLVADPHA